MGRAARAKHRATTRHTRSRSITGVLAVVVLGVAVALTFLALAALALDGSRDAIAAGSGASAPTPTVGVAASSGVMPERAAIDRVSRARRPSPADLTPRYAADAPVLLLGDSLDVGIADQLVAGWPDRAVTVEAEVGRSTSTAAALLADHADGTGPVWVVSLGTNDAPEDFPAAAREVLRLAGPSRCVVWFDVHRPSDQGAVNATLGRLAVRTPTLHVLGWHALAQVHPEWFGWDGIHPSTDGYLARAVMASDAVARYCTAGGQGAKARPAAVGALRPPAWPDLS